MSYAGRHTVMIFAAVTVCLGLLSCSLPRDAEIETARDLSAVEQRIAKYAVQHLGGLHPDSQLESTLTAMTGRLAESCGLSSEGLSLRIVFDAPGYPRRLPGGDILIGRERLLAVQSDFEVAALLVSRLLTPAPKTEQYALLLERLARQSDSFETSLQIAEAVPGILKQSATADSSDGALQAVVSCLGRTGYGQVPARSLEALLTASASFPAASDAAAQWAEPICPPVADVLTSRLLNPTQCRAYALYRRAQALEQIGQLNEALEIYHRAMRAEPDQAFWLCRLGIAYLRRDDPVPAHRYLTRAERLDDQDYQTQLALGYLHLEDHRWDQAEQALERSFELLPTLQGGFLLAEVKRQQGDTPAAVELYRAVRESAPGSRLARVAGERLREL